MSVFRYGQKMRTFGTGYLETGENPIAEDRHSRNQKSFDVVFAY